MILDLTQPSDVLKRQIRQAAQKLAAAKIQRDAAESHGAKMVCRELVLDQEWTIDMLRAELARRKSGATSEQPQ